VTSRLNGLTNGTNTQSPGGADTILDDTGNLILMNVAAGDRGLDGDLFNFLYYQTPPLTNEWPIVDTRIMAMNGVT
jgi:hypothetical protein